MSAVPKAGLIKTADGRVLPLTIKEYDDLRPAENSEVGFRRFCNAPFVNMDFAPTGEVSLCNHTFAGKIGRFPGDETILQIWRGQKLSSFRKQMIEFEVPLGCDHCIHQVETLNVANAFSVSHFDRTIPSCESPKYPKRMIFRLANTCNLACVMCDGETSSRIRKDRDKEAPFPAFYNDKFYEDLEEVLAHVEHLEFYGGEPFLVREHRRVFEVLMKIKAKCTIFINTNCMALNAFAKQCLRELNVSTVVISMDAYHAEVHENVRLGLHSDLFFKNAAHLLALRQTKKFSLSINMTEHRKNWFDLPNVFRWAEANEMNVHVNHCVHPVNVSLYSLPLDELRYVSEYWEEEKESIKADFPRFRNERNYDYMISLVKGEMVRPMRHLAVPGGPINAESNGFLEAPIPTLVPFDSPERMLREVERISKLNLRTKNYMAGKICMHLKKKQLHGNWHLVEEKAKELQEEGLAVGS